MRETLESLAAGECTVAEAEAALSGYATTEAGRFDAARERRGGVPEAILAEGKTPDEVADLAATALATTDRAIVTRADAADVAAVRAALETDGAFADGDATAEPDCATDATDGGSAATVEHHERAGVLVARTPAHERPALDATVGVVTAGTADAAVAGEAAAIAGEMGAAVERVDDVGVAAITRLVDRLPELRETDVLVVAAGREGALPTVVAGLVDVPVIGLPVSTGYGHGGEGRAALAGMLQSCTELSVVNVDAGYVAGAQAGLIARAISAARADD